MHLKNKLILMIVLILASVSVLAITQPENPEDPFSSPQLLSVYGDSALPPLDITTSPLSIMGSECSNLYVTTGEYCSGHVRIYYQCLQTMEGAEWQQRNENCEDYSGRCIEEDGKAKCVDGYGQTGFGKKLLIWGIGLLIVGAVAGYFIHPILFLVAVYGVWLLIKFFLGGV